MGPDGELEPGRRLAQRVRHLRTARSAQNHRSAAQRALAPAAQQTAAAITHYPVGVRIIYTDGGCDGNVARPQLLRCVWLGRLCDRKDGEGLFPPARVTCWLGWPAPLLAQNAPPCGGSSATAP